MILSKRGQEIYDELQEQKGLDQTPIINIKYQPPNRYYQNQPSWKMYCYFRDYMISEGKYIKDGEKTCLCVNELTIKDIINIYECARSEINKNKIFKKKTCLFWTLGHSIYDLTNTQFLNLFKYETEINKVSTIPKSYKNQYIICLNLLHHKFKVIEKHIESSGEFDPETNFMFKVIDLERLNGYKEENFFIGTIRSFKYIVLGVDKKLYDEINAIYPHEYYYIK
jgi:hypothetical protein